MRRAAYTLVLVLAATLLLWTPTLAQAAPQFTLGFQTLASLIPDIVGQPVEQERHDPQTGDGLQRTTTGLMVWRKADNLTAFTNGSTTWINGPFGLQSRPNNVRFSWERAEAPPSLPDNAAALTFSRSPGGTWVGQGTVRNPLSQAMDAEINVIGFNKGAPVTDAPTLFVRNLAPGASQPVEVLVPSAAEVDAWQTRIASRPVAARGDPLDVGTSRGLIVEDGLVGTVAELRKVEGGEWLVRVAAENGITIGEAAAGPGILGAFDDREGIILINSALDDSSAWVRAAVLAHELQHAADAAASLLPETTAECLRFEAHAFQRQSTIWTQFWQGSFPEAVDAIHEELNDVAFTVAHDPETFASILARRYRSECGPLPLRPRR